MKNELVKSQYRLPKRTHEAMVECANLLRQSQNEFVVDCVDAIIEMIHAPSLAEITIPDVVAKAQAVQANRKTPVTIYHLHQTKGGRVAEEQPTARGKRHSA